MVNVLSRAESIPKRKFTPRQVIKTYGEFSSSSREFRVTPSWVGNGYCFMKKEYLRGKLLERVEEVQIDILAEQTEYYEEAYTKMFERMKIGEDRYELLPIAILPERENYNEIGKYRESLVLMVKKEKDILVTVVTRYFKFFVDSAKIVKFYQGESEKGEIEVCFEKKRERVGYIMPDMIDFGENMEILLKRLRRKFDV